MADLITVLEAREYIKGSASDDAFLTPIVAAVSQRIRTYCNQQFETAAYTEFFDGGDEVMIVDFPPIASAPAVVVTDTLPSPDEVLAAADYVIYPEEGFIETADGSAFSKGKRRWQVDYTGGLSSVPEDVKLAAKMFVASIFSTPNMNITEERIGDYSYKLADVMSNESLLPAGVSDLLSAYVIQDF